MDPTPNPLLSAALELAALGYPVFPLRPGSKKPATHDGFKSATTDPDTIQQWWHHQPRANIGLATAGLIVVDVDPGAGEHKQITDAQWVELQQAGTIAKTPRGGRHIMFRQPPGRAWTIGQDQLAPHVDHRGDGGYIVAAPSEVDGKVYRWLGELPPADRLNEPPAFLTATFDRLYSGRVSGPAEPIPDAATEGGRHKLLLSTAGKLRHAGLNEDEIRAALDVVNQTRCNPPKSAKDIDKIASSVARYAVGDVIDAITAGAEDFGPMRVKGAMVTWGEPQPPTINDIGAQLHDSTDPGTCPVGPPPGLCERIVQYNLLTAHRPQPMLALGGALTLVAALTSRKIQGHTGLRTNTYAVGIAPSGTGKEHAMAVNEHVLAAANAGHLMGQGDLASDAGLISELSERPALLKQVDEIGRLLRTMGDPRATHLYGIPTTLLKLWSKAGGTYRGKAYADSKKNITIEQPCLSILGASVPGSLYEGLTHTSLTDGLIARLLVFTGDEDPMHQPNAGLCPLDREDPASRTLLEQVEYWANFRPHTGNLGSVYPTPAVVRPTPDAEDRIEAFVEAVHEQTHQADEPVRAIWGRAVEHSLKLALLHVASRGKHDELDLAAVEWGIAFADWHARHVLYLASQWVADSEHHAKQQRVLRWLRERGGSCTVRELGRKFHWKTRERDEVVESLVVSGHCVVCSGGAGRGRYASRLQLSDNAGV